MTEAILHGNNFNFNFTAGGRKILRIFTYSDYKTFAQISSSKNTVNSADGMHLRSFIDILINHIK